MNFQEAFYRMLQGELISHESWEDSYICIYDYHKIDYNEVYFSMIQQVTFDEKKIRHHTNWYPIISDIIFDSSIWDIYPDDRERNAFKAFNEKGN